MSYTAVVLIVISATVHATWNLRGKSRNPSAAFFLVGDGTIALLGMPLWFVFRKLYADLPASFWGLVAATGASQAVYYIGLAYAYRSGDLSIAYPLIRALPVLFIPALSFLLERGKQIHALGLCGMGAIAAGCVFMALYQFFRGARAGRTSMFFAVIGALGSVGYTMIDDEALHLIKASPAFTLEPGLAALTYIPAITSSTALWLTLFTCFNRGERAAFGEIWRTARLYTALTGVMIWLSYGLALAAMVYVTDVSYVAAFRQLSIPIGAVLGMTLLKEPRLPARIIGVAIIAAGLVLVALG